MSFCFFRLFWGICRCVVGTGVPVSSATDLAERFLLRSGCEIEFRVNFSEVSRLLTFTPPRTILWCPFFCFLFGPGVFTAAFRCLSVGLPVYVVSVAVGVAIHGVDGSSMPEE